MNGARFRWTSSAASDVGLVRRTNEDACLDLPLRGLWVVADGMGGHAHGEVASSMVVAGLAGIAAPATMPAFVQSVRLGLQAVNQALLAKAIRNNVPIIGSTVVALLALGNACTVLWAGDSRAYLLRSGSLRKLTQDHDGQSRAISVRIPGADPVVGGVCVADAGMIEGIGNGPGSMRGTGSGITRAVGAADILEVDETQLAVEDGDVLLLCSDGLTREVSDAEIARLLAHGNNRLATQALIALALQHGGRDNVSVIVVTVEDLWSADRTVINPAC